VVVSTALVVSGPGAEGANHYARWVTSEVSRPIAPAADADGEPAAPSGAPAQIER
jgi:hypothetical protein